MRLLCSLLFFLFGISASAAETPPNILFIIGDDHAAYAMGAYGHKSVRTPNMDALAAQGMRFSHAYCNAPVCTPSRQSFLTGRLPHAAGVTQLTTALEDKEITLAEHLTAHGYDCATFGKMHLNSKLKHGFDQLQDFPEVPQRKDGDAPLPETELFPPWKPFKDPASIWLNSTRLPQPALDANFGATKIANAAAAFLEQPRQKPFFLIASFHQPHSPFQFPADFKDRVDPASLEFPAEPLPHDRAQIPLIFRDLTPDQKRGIAAAYCTAVNYLDTKIGRVLEALEKSGHARNTVVFYFSDHGYALGQHGRFEKHAFFEESVRMPLIVRWPGKVAPAVTSALVELVDLFPTACEIAAVPLPPDRHGQSLLPILNGSKPALHEHVVSQYNENEELMIRTNEWKLIYCSGKRIRNDGYKTDNPTPGSYMRLYNMINDPGELDDRLAKPDEVTDAVIAKLIPALLHRLESTARPEDRAASEKLRTRFEKLDYFAQPYEVRCKAK